MSIALFPSSFYPHVGGVEEAVRQLALSYRASGQDVVILTNRWPRSLPASEEFEELPVRRHLFRLPQLPLRNLARAAVLARPTLRRICREVVAHRAEIIHVQCVSTNGYFALRASRRLGIPLVATLQGELTMDATDVYGRSPALRRTLRTLLEEADAVTACSQHTLDEAQAFWGHSLGDRGRVIHNGVRMADFVGVSPFQHARPYVFAIGRLVPQKGFDVLIQAFGAMLQSGCRSHDLLIAGDGPERAALEDLATSIGVGDRVRLLGNVGRDEVAPLFAGCSFFVLPSRHEPMGMVNLEAMASGKAILASAVGGVPELIHEGKNGLLVSPDDVSALAARLATLVEDPALRERLGRAGSLEAQKFDWDRIARSYQETYEQARARRARALRVRQAM
ncbi:MAG: glycosyltransferase family 4 protein [Actinomycetota bacterium]|nr:glycosyltransferase family 4 protein [Actinomycetota bacterium]